MGTVHPLTPRTAASAAPAHEHPTPISSLTYTVTEVADMLRLNLGGTYRMIRNGDIPARKLGSRWVIPRRAFHDWLNDLKVTPTSPTPDDLTADLGTLTATEVALIWAHRNGA